MTFKNLQYKVLKLPLSINRRKKGIRVRDVFFAERMEQIELHNTDIIYSVQCSEPAPSCTEFYTSIVDLQQTAESVYNGISKSFRYEIRRAEKDYLHLELIDDPTHDQIVSFAAYYDTFALRKGIAGVNLSKLLQLAKVNSLNLAMVCGGDPKQPLAAHAYIVNGERARLYYSVSCAVQDEYTLLRQQAGRANKALHWYCMKQYQSRGYLRYDLGGISMSEALKTIDDFKQQFGGVLIKEFNIILATSIVGRLALGILRLISCIKAR